MYVTVRTVLQSKRCWLDIAGVWTTEGKGGVRMWIDRAARVEIGRALWWNPGMYNTHRVGRRGTELELEHVQHT